MPAHNSGHLLRAYSASGPREGWGSGAGAVTGTRAGTVSQDGATILDQLSVLGKLSVDEIFTTGGIQTGQLRMEGFNTCPTDASGTGVSGTADSNEGAVEGISSIDTLAGALLLQSHAQGSIEIMGGRTVIDKLGNLVMKEGSLKLQKGDIELEKGALNLKKGVLSGNDSFTGSVVLSAEKQEIRIPHSWENKPKAVFITPKNADIRWSIADLSSEGFVIKIVPSQATDTRLYWMAVF
ncbi:MAG: hypothetical protein N2691_04275 [Patescibacteria group bacterium]|nr:hypothetical protein [Patescibacteria group bacterium]